MPAAAAVEGFDPAFTCTYGVLLVRMFAECVVQEARLEEADARQRSHSPQFAELGRCHEYLIDG